MSTAHISAKKGEIAKNVIMAGDPIRAKNWAEKYLKDWKIVSEVRNIYVITGKLSNGHEVTVMGHGMGLESIGIYAYELYKFYDVERIIRFGSAGSYSKDIDLYQFIIGKESYTDSNYGLGFMDNETEYISASSNLVELAKQSAEKLSINYLEGTVHASPWFYKEFNKKPISWFNEKNILCVEMESYALYSIANYFKKESLTVLTISDNLVLQTETTPQERAEKFTDMFDVVNEMLLNL